MSGTGAPGNFREYDTHTHTHWNSHCAPELRERLGAPKGIQKTYFSTPDETSCHVQFYTNKSASPLVGPPGCRPKLR
eukprot:8485167-Pyramimonas_sp.AAC.1